MYLDKGGSTSPERPAPANRAIGLTDPRMNDNNYSKNNKVTFSVMK
jgi:hypothetical protein